MLNDSEQADLAQAILGFLMIEAVGGDQVAIDILDYFNVKAEIFNDEAVLVKQC